MPPVSSPGSHGRRHELGVKSKRPDQDRASRIRFRRAITLVLMTLLVPGSAQVVAGNRRTGVLAMMVWLGIGILVGFALLIGLIWHGFAFWLASSTFWLGVIRIVLVLLAVGWAALFMDAWRLGQPLSLHQNQRLVIVGLNGLLCFSVAGVLLFGSHLVNVQRDFIITMFGDGEKSEATDGRYNVLLLGGDSGKGRWGLRPDSLTVASIDADTGKTVLFGLPRNMMNFPFPKGSILAEQFPDGYDCEGCELNSLATWAGDHKGLFKGYDEPGVEATKEGVEGITGLKINYYAMVNLEGFKELVDALGGLTLNVREAVPIGKIGAVTGYVEPGIRNLDGYETLWFARSRSAADDYSRMARQKCVMNAMLHQLSPSKVVTKFEAIEKATTGLLSTDLPASELGNFADLAMKAKEQPIRSVSFVPPAINTGDPDIDKIRAMIAKAIDGPVKAPKHQTANADGFTTKDAQTTGASKGDIHKGYAANQSANLSSAC